MTHSEIRHLLAGIMVMASLFVLGRAVMAYAARKSWQGTALVIGGSVTEQQQRGMEVG